MSTVEKKSKARQRHKDVVDAFEKWLATHPKATHKEQFDTFDMYCDSAFLRDTLAKVTTNGAGAVIK